MATSQPQFLPPQLAPDLLARQLQVRQKGKSSALWPEQPTQAQWDQTASGERPTSNQPQFTPPQYAPDLLARALSMQQQKEWGERMLEDGSQMPEGQMVSGHFVAPSPTQYAAALMKSYIGGKARADMPQKQADLNRDVGEAKRRRFYGEPSTQALSTALNAGGAAQSMPATDNPQTSNTGNVVPAHGGVPRLPGMTEDMSWQIYSSMDEASYLKLLAQHLSPTESQKHAAGAGMTPGTSEYQRLMADLLAKDTHIAPLSASPGATLLDPRTNTPIFNAPQDGVQLQYGSDGAATATPVPGYRDIQAGNAGATTRAQEEARAELDLVAVPDGQGGTRMMPRDEAARVLGGGNGGGAPSGGGLGSSPSPVSQSAATKLNDDWVSGSYRPTLDAAGAASNLIGTITAMRAIPLDTGFGAEYQGAAANLLTSLGVENAASVATNTQKFQSLAMDRLQTELMKQKGPQTEGDAERAGQTFAKLGNTPEANKFIFDFAEAKANMDMRKAAFYEAALPLARQSGDLTEVDRRWRALQGSVWDDPLLTPYKGM